MKTGMSRNKANVWAQEYQRGREACRRGMSYHQNPHKSGTIAYQAWARGWNARQYQGKTEPFGSLRPSQQPNPEEKGRLVPIEGDDPEEVIGMEREY